MDKNTKNKKSVGRKIVSGVGTVGFVIGVILMTVMLFTLTAGICSRYIFNRPFFWTDEMARIVLIWTIFIGAALAFQKNSPINHINVDFFITLLPSKGREITKKIALGTTVFFCIIMFLISVRFIPQAGFIKTAALGLPKIIIYITLPIFAAVSLVFLIEQILTWNRKNGGGR